MSNTAIAHAHQFDDASQQREAATFGMWIFLATEILFFGGLFLGYTVYRNAYPAAFAAASRHTLLLFGGTNTAVLLISSAMMAFAVRAAQEQKRMALVVRLFATAVLGALFLGIKGFEYAREISDHLLPGNSFEFPPPYAPHARMFFYLYFLMTGVHALHVLIGVVLIGTFGIRALFSDRLAGQSTAVDLLGLYWHFVDIVWVVLFPLIYLVGRNA
jgi:cytochrome c oxidase subunit 3